MDEYKYRLLGLPTTIIKDQKYWKFLPFFVHFLVTASVAAFMLLYVDGRQFNLSSRGPSFIESDGSVSRIDHYIPMQSDITTVVSLAGTATRLAAGWWAGNVVWRCVLLFLKKGKISLRGVKQATKFPLSSLNGLQRKTDWAILSLALIATFSMEIYSSVLTGSITWSQSYTSVKGNMPLTGVHLTNTTTIIESPFTWSPIDLMAVGTSLAVAAWSTLGSVEMSTVQAPPLKRVLKSARHLSVNSSVGDLTLPFFIVKSFEWINDPNATLTPKQKALINRDAESPFYSSYGVHVGLIPDDLWNPWNRLHVTEPDTVSETRPLAYRVGWYHDGDGCSRRNMTSFGPQIQPFARLDDPNDCFAVANVTYKAGAAVCRNCRVVAPGVFQSDGPLTFIPDALTRAALAFSPSLGMHMIMGGESIPENLSPQDYAITVISRSYQAAWMAISTMYMLPTGQAETMISVPVSRATVVPWRVYLWVALHMSVFLGGLLFVYLHRLYDLTWVDDPVLAAFLLPNGDVMDSKLWNGVDPWRVAGADMPKPNGFLQLEGDGVKGYRIQWDFETKSEMQASRRISHSGTELAD